jgi:hypothetical protein
MSVPTEFLNAPRRQTTSAIRRAIATAVNAMKENYND